MHIDDFLAQQMLKANQPTPPRPVSAAQPHRRLLRAGWRRVRQAAQRFDALRRPRRDSNARPTA